MDRDKKIRDHKKVINDFVSGKAKLQGEHPEDVTKAINAFFHAGKMLIDTPEISHIPSEYITNLLEVLSKYPQYRYLALDLVEILKRGDEISI